VGYKKAVHLAKYLEMTAILHNTHYFAIHKRLSALQLKDFWDNNPNIRYTDKVNNDNLTISQSISSAVSKLSSQEESDLSNLNDISLLEKNYRDC
jgi:hypothetical protein